MIQHVWSVLGQFISIDKDANMASIINVIEEITIIGNPSKDQPTVISLELLSLWCRGQDDNPVSGMMRAYYVGPIEGHSSDISLPITLEKNRFHRTRIRAGVVPIFVPGMYSFIVEYKVDGSQVWEHAARVPFYVNFVTSPNK